MKPPALKPTGLKLAVSGDVTGNFSMADYGKLSANDKCGSSGSGVPQYDPYVFIVNAVQANGGSTPSFSLTLGSYTGPGDYKITPTPAGGSTTRAYASLSTFKGQTSLELESQSGTITVGDGGASGKVDADLAQIDNNHKLLAGGAKGHLTADWQCAPI